MALIHIQKLTRRAEHLVARLNRKFYFVIGKFRKKNNEKYNKFFEKKLNDSFYSKKLSIDFNGLNEDSLMELLDRTAETWINLGKKTPHWSVSTEDIYKPELLSKNEESFWNAGNHEVELFCSALNRIGLNRKEFSTLSILELGCGVGRVSFPLAEIFGRVKAVDISEPHLSVLHEQSKKRRLGNRLWVSHIQNVGDIAKLPLSDIFYSIITLQHNPPPVQKELIKTCISRINPGGYFYFQLPTYIPGYKFSLDDYLLTSNQEMEMHVVEMPEVISTLKSLNCDLQFILRDNRTGPVYESHTFMGKVK